MTVAAQPISFFEKSKSDYSDTSVLATASQGSAYASLALNRSNNTAWVTTGSVDADNTTFTVDMVNSHAIDTIILIKHNFKKYTIKYWNGYVYVDFPTAINVSVNALASTVHYFTEVTTTKIQITITKTIVINADKYLYQFIATKKIGQLTSWPVITTISSRNKKVSESLSGKKIIREFVGFTEYDLAVKVLSTAADLTIIETLYKTNFGFLVWICGGDDTQFTNKLIGYKMEDIKLMKAQDEYSPSFLDGLYKRGIPIKMKLMEVTD